MNGHKYKFLFILQLSFFLIGCASVGYDQPVYESARQAHQKENYRTAIQHYEQFIREEPDSTLKEVALYYLGICYQKTGDHKMAKDSFGKLIVKYKTGFWVDAAKEELGKLKE